MSKFKHNLVRAHVMLSASILTMASVSLAQDETQDDEDVVVVQGIRGSIQESLEAKRETAVVSDALIGVEIGDLPDLSIAESLERITGVTSDRFKGGASEVSIRGLGAYLSYSTLNGREITSGSDGRDVNFGQFPSELFEGVQVYKSQQASLVEGGISGVISLQTLRPLDYGKRRLQMNGLVGFSEYEDRVDDGDPYSERLTVSYVDQWEGSSFGEFGIAIGGQIRRDTAPEDIYTSSSTWRPCTTVDGSNCSYDPMDAESTTYFVSNQYVYRAMQTEADRDAIMANLQWRPNERTEFNADFQWSDRKDLEVRHNLVIADGRRGIIPIDISEDSGALLAWQGNTRLENQSVYRPRLEEYVGGGLSAEFEVSDQLTLTADFGYSKTERRQDERDMRIRTNDRVEFIIDTRGYEIPSLELIDVSEVEYDTGLTFDLNNHDLYTNGARARRRLENIDDESIAFRVDGTYLLNNDVWTSVEAGFRVGERQRIHDDGIDTTLSLVNGYDDDAVIATRRDTFVNDNLYEGADTPLEGISWATWEPYALFTALTGSEDAGLPTGSTLSPDDTDVTETTVAAYVQGNFATNMFSRPVSGNVGLRIVQTDVESRGISQDFTAVQSMVDPMLTTLVPVGDASVNTEKNDFINVLPSVNLNFELREDMLFRVAAYRAISRPDMEAMSAALAVNDDEDGFDLDALSDNVSASGNPGLEPLSSWNGDISWEWYYSDDTAVSVAAYYKKLETGLDIISSETSIVVDGQPQPVTVNRQGNSDESSDLIGLEISVQHVFSNLPGIMSNFGIRGGVNFADSDFEYPDPTSQNGADLADLTKPLNIPGYSPISGNLTAFWENDDLSLRLAYKGRSGYNKPFRSDSNRYTGAQDFVDFSASYDLTDNIELRVQGLNLLDEPNIFYRPVKDSFGQADFSGRRFFIGARAKF